MEAESLKFGTHIRYMKHVLKTILWFCGLSCGYST